mgnify:CR=1 FL=1
MEINLKIKIKMKKTIKTLLVLLLSVITFSSCSKDDDSVTGSINPELVGTWESTTHETVITFKSDGTGFDELNDTFNWGATSSIITIQWVYPDSPDVIDEIEKSPYEFLDENRISVKFEVEENVYETHIYIRL